MNTIRCSLCKKPYEYSGMPPKCCPECYLREEEQYQRVRALVKERPGINIIDAARESGVPHRKIMQYLREERLEALPSSTEFLHCHACGKMINTGMYCADCKRRYGENGPRETSSKEKEPDLDKNVYNVENVNIEPKRKK